MRIKLVVSYDGRPFQGWQSQPGGNTVQDRIQSALAEICKTGVTMHGSGRTDTGVHALGQVAHFDAPAKTDLDPVSWGRALNANLPGSIRVLSCEKADGDFHARFSATAKTYRYEIDRGEVLSPFRTGLAWHLPPRIALDDQVLAEVAELLTGEHDFGSFAANRGDGKKVSTVRRIGGIEIERPCESLTLTFRGNGFLYKMVRLLVGSMIRCAQGKETVDWLRNLLDNPTGETTRYCAPADGLYLVEVCYD